MDNRCLLKFVLGQWSALTWAVKTDLYDHLDGYSILDGSSDSLGQLKNMMRADI